MPIITPDRCLRLPLATFERLRDSLVITDATIEEPGPFIVYVNQAFLRMSGYHASELRGLSPRIMQGAETDRGVLDRLRACLLEGRTFEGESINYRKDGTPFPMRWTIEPIVDEAGTTTHFFAIQRDLSVPSSESKSATTASSLPPPPPLPFLRRAVRTRLQGRDAPIEGLSLTGIAQLLEVERKTCRLTATWNDRRGQLLFRNGRLIDAATEGLQGDLAALEILAWDDNATFDLRMGEFHDPVTVSGSLRQLMLEAMARKDERSAEVTASRAARPEVEPWDQAPIANGLSAAMEIDGVIGASLVDLQREAVIAQAGGSPGLRLDVAATGNIEVLQHERAVIESLGLDDEIEDILITLPRHYHLIRPLTQVPRHFLYLVLRRRQSTLAMARRQLRSIDLAFAA